MNENSLGQPAELEPQALLGSIDDPQQSEDSPSSPEEEMIEDSRSLELISRIGWIRYRELLSQMSYADIIRHQKPTIEALRTAGQQSMIQAENKKNNLAQKERIDQFQSHLPYKTDQARFWCDRSKKIWMQGNRESPDESLLTRVYLACPTQRMLRVFSSLCNRLHDAGIAQCVSVALNLENFQGEDIDKYFETNNIVVYINGKADGPLMARFVRILLEIKENTEDWQMPESDLASCQEQILRQCMIPLDEQVAFVEMPEVHGRSYHAGECGSILEFFGLNAWGGSAKTLDDYINRLERRGNAPLETFEPDGRVDRDYSQMPYRHANMPALVYRNE